MSDNVESNSRVIDVNNFLAGSAFQFICELKKDAIRSDAPSKILEDWEIIEAWLGCNGRSLNQQDKERIGRAYKSYAARGIAPLLKLQPVFDEYRQQAKREKWEIVRVPSVVMDVFDRLLATDKEIAEKKQAEQQMLNKIIEQRKLIKQSGSKTTDVPPTSRFFNRQGRILIAGIAIWAIYVIFRTWDYQEVFGVELERWDSSSFWLNLLSPPVAILVGLCLRRWILRGNS